MYPKVIGWYYPCNTLKAHISQFPEIITVISKAKRSLSVKVSSPHNTNPYDGQKQTKCGCLRLLHDKVFRISDWILMKTDHYWCGENTWCWCILNWNSTFHCLHSFCGNLCGKCSRILDWGWPCYLTWITQMIVMPILGQAWSSSHRFCRCNILTY